MKNLVFILIIILYFIKYVYPTFCRQYYNSDIFEVNYFKPSSEIALSSASTLGNDAFKQWSMGYWIKIISIWSGQAELIRLRTADSSACLVESRRIVFFITDSETLSIGLQCVPITTYTVTYDFKDNVWYYFYTSIAYGNLNQQNSKIYFMGFDTSNMKYFALSNNNPSLFTYSETNPSITLSNLKLTFGNFDVLQQDGDIQIQQFSLILDNFITSDWIYYFSNGGGGIQVASYYFDENAGQYVNDYSGYLLYTAILGTSDQNLNHDPIWSTSNSMGIKFMGKSIVTLPQAIFTGQDMYFTVSYWIQLTEIQSCNANIFIRRNEEKTKFKLFLNANTSDVYLIQNQTNQLNLQASYPLNLWIHYTIGCNGQFGKTLIECLSFKYEPWNPNTIIKKQFFTAGKYDFDNSDLGYLGDTTCSFIGFLKIFTISGDSMSFPQFGDNCNPNVKLSVGIVSPDNALLYSTAVNCVGSREYYSKVFQRCLKCDIRCNKCIIGQNYQCTSCSNSLILSGENQICSCTNSNSFYNTDWAICQPCYANCQTCTGPNDDQCTSCIQSYFLIGTQCVNPCSDGYYGNSTSNKCLPCDKSCATCSNSSINGCLSCNLGFLLNNGYCISGCILNQKYYNSTLNACDDCHSMCYTCSGPTANQCTSCAGKYSYYYQDKCYLTCPSGTYSQGLLCFPCHPSCKTCSISSTSCTSCNSGYFLYGTTCALTCPSNTRLYPDMTENMCKLCDSSCLTCSGPLSTDCTTCLNKLLNGQCLSYCPIGYFSSSLLTCSSCALNCATCTGSNPAQCTSCMNNTFYYNGECYINCPEQLVGDPNTSMCVDCYDPNCLNCSGPTDGQCQACLTGYYLLSGSCVINCPSIGQYADSNRVCQLCDPSCKTCNDSTPTSCLTCDDEYFFWNSECLDECPYGTITRDDIKVCQENNCAPLCLNCSNNYNNCTSCIKGVFFYENFCYQTCPQATYAELDLMTCISCSPECLSCIGPTKYECISCPEPKILSSSLGGYCILPCDNGTFYDNITQDCVKCDISCKTCINGTVSTCTSCAIGYSQVSYTNIPSSSSSEWIGWCALTQQNTINDIEYTLWFSPISSNLALYVNLFQCIFFFILELICLYKDAKFIKNMNPSDIKSLLLNDIRGMTFDPSNPRLDIQIEDSKLFRKLRTLKSLTNPLPNSLIKYMIQDIKYHHSFINIFTYYSPFSPRYLRALIFHLKLIIFIDFLEILNLPPEYNYIISACVMIFGNTIVYIIAIFIRVPKPRIIKLFSCTPTQWKSKYNRMKSNILLNELTLSIIYMSLLVLSIYYSIAFEDKFGHLRFLQILENLLVVIGYDIGIFGFLPSFILGMLRRHDFIVIEDIFRSMRAYRSLRY